MYVVLVLVAILSTLAPMHAQTMLAALPIISPSQPLLDPRALAQRTASRPAQQIDQIAPPSVPLTRPEAPQLPAQLSGMQPGTVSRPLSASLGWNYAANAP